ncbi:MAG: flagellar motor switch protein FliM [Fimbriimonadaceae bacterium]
MSDVLSKAEIESLIGTLASEAEGEPLRRPSQGQEKPQRTRGVVAYEVYDFRRPDKFSKEQLRTLQMLNEGFGRLAGSSLAANLRLPVSFELVALEQVPYEEYLRGISSSAFVLLSLPPLQGQAVLEIEFPVAFSMVDRLLGGPGRPFARQIFTDIEAPLVREIVGRLCQCLVSAWEGLATIEPKIDGIEVSSQFVQISPPSDIVISSLFEVKMGDTRGALSLCIPYTMLKGVTSRLSGNKWIATGQKKPARKADSALSTMIKGVDVTCAVHMTPTPIRFEDFTKIEVGQVVPLNHKVDQELLLHVQGVPVHVGKMALEGSKLAFTVTATPELAGNPEGTQ